MSTNTQESINKIDTKLQLYSASKLVLWALLAVIGVTFSVVMYLTLTEVKGFTQLLVDCTTPQGNCYKNGDRRQSGAVKTITDQQKQVVTIAAYCSKQPGNNTLQQIEDCVEMELNRK